MKPRKKMKWYTLSKRSRDKVDLVLKLMKSRKNGNRTVSTIERYIKLANFLIRITKCTE